MDSLQKLRDTDAVVKRHQVGERSGYLSLVLVSQTWPVPVSSPPEEAAGRRPPALQHLGAGLAAGLGKGIRDTGSSSCHFRPLAC